MKLTVDGVEVEVENGMTVLQACEQAGAEVPRFCYHERLSIAGNCRMCLVEVEKSPKPVASCAMPAAEGMVVKTTTDMVKKARQGVMEFLLINHPLDCPICDQGGECDLQDQAMAFGSDHSRYIENKRAVEDKELGPIVKTVMTRCIHCTRCIRFATEVAGVPELGGIGRGEHMEVGTYVEKTLSTELSGNLVDLCPVGALTSKPYAFHSRPWELSKTETIDVMDAIGSNIRVDSRGAEVLRVLPRLNEDVNEEWIHDKTRHACDGLKRQRLDRPYVRNIKGKLVETSWDEALQTIANKVAMTKTNRIAALAGDLVDVESAFALKSLMNLLGSPHLDCRQDGAAIDPENRAGYLFNTTIAGVENADAILLIGTDPRHEASLINTRIRKRYLKGGLKVAMVGEPVDLTYPYEHLGNSASLLEEILAGKHEFSKVLKTAQNPMIILGAGALRRNDGAAILFAARAIAEKFKMIRDDWNGFNLLHLVAGRVGALDAGFVPGAKGKDTRGIMDAALKGEMDIVYLLGADEIDVRSLKKTFVVYQGHHGDAGASVADVILPGAAYTEKNALYVNTEGRVQEAFYAILPPGQAKEDWKILRALSEYLGLALPFNTHEQLRAALSNANPIFAKYDQVTPAKWGKFGVEGKIAKAGFTAPIANFYMTDPISRNSVTMAKCTENAKQNLIEAA